MKPQLFGLLGVAAAAPTTLQTRGEEGYKWPAFCDDTQYRDAALFKGEKGDTGNVFRSTTVLASYAYNPKGDTGADQSFPLWLANYLDGNYDWKCDGAGCTISNFAEECKETRGNADLGLVLEGTQNVYAYLKSLQASINTQAEHIKGKIPSMREMFGAVEVEDKTDWNQRLEMVAAGVGVVGAVLASSVNPAAGASVALANGALGVAKAIAVHLAPEEDAEEDFHWASEQESGFTDSVQVINKAIDNYIINQMEKPIEDIRMWLDDGGNYLKLLEDGRFAAAPLPPKVANSDINVLAGLAAPLVNELWKKAQIFVARFDGPKWEQMFGKHFCGDDTSFFPELQPDSKICDPDNSLYLLLHFENELKVDGTSEGYLRNMKGIMELEPSFGINRRQIVYGSLKNHIKHGYFTGKDYSITKDDLLERLENLDAIDGIVAGKLNVWGLPFCEATFDFSEMREGTKEKLRNNPEEMIGLAAAECGSHKDQFGNDWPYGIFAGYEQGE